MQAKESYVLRQVADNYVIVPVGEETLQYPGICTCNETGAFLWQQLQQERTPEQLTAALLEEYAVSPEVAAADVARFAQALQNAGLLK